MTSEIRAVLVDSIVDPGAPPGAIKFYRTNEHNPAGFHFRSVNLDGGHWHGWLTDGIWRAC